MAIDRGDRGKCSIVEECMSGFFFSYSEFLKEEANISTIVESGVSAHERDERDTITFGTISCLHIRLSQPRGMHWGRMGSCQTAELRSLHQQDGEASDGLPPGVALILARGPGKSICQLLHLVYSSLIPATQGLNH